VHEQLAEGWAPAQGLPEGQVTRAAIFTHPRVSVVQVATVVPVSQKLPWPAAHPGGAAGQPQAAPGLDP
jgi:hypothetical protein